MFALRLRPAKFVVLSPTEIGTARQLSRLAFMGATGAALVKRVGNKVAARLAWCARVWEEALARAVEIQRSRGMAASATDDARAGHGVGSILAPMGIRILDRRYRRMFRELFRVRWDQRFTVTNGPRDSITLVIGSLEPGGSEGQAVTTLLGLAARGYRDLSLLCARLNGPVDGFYAHLLDGTPVSVAEVSEGLGWESNSGLDHDAETAAGLRLLFEKLREEMTDVTWYAREFLVRKPRIAHIWLDYPNAKAGIAAAVAGVPRIILSTRSLPPTHFGFFQPYMREAYRALARYPSVCFLNNSEAGARSYEQWLGLPHGTFKVVHNGVDFSRLERDRMAWPAREVRARFDIPGDVPLVGSVLRFSEEKRPFLWLEVAARVGERRPDAMFLMVGDGPLWEEARSRAKARGMGSRIVMPGHEKHVAAMIAAMDVFLLTSRVEGLPNVLIEAQALGVPVVSTDRGGAGETMIRGKTGYVVVPESADVLADVIVHILADAAWRQDARNAAQAFVREQFSVSQMIDATVDAYFARGQFAAHLGSVHEAGLYAKNR
jgi:glycosyltransferase involved in cell wall biosynthesis